MWVWERTTKIHMFKTNCTLCSRYMLVVLGSIVNVIAVTYMTTSWARESSLWWWIRYSCELQKSWGEQLLAWFGFANDLATIACFISYEKWAQREKYPNNTRLLYARVQQARTAWVQTSVLQSYISGLKCRTMVHSIGFRLCVGFEYAYLNSSLFLKYPEQSRLQSAGDFLVDNIVGHLLLAYNNVGYLTHVVGSFSWHIFLIWLLENQKMFRGLKQGKHSLCQVPSLQI